jgi:hypothetical protein
MAADSFRHDYESNLEENVVMIEDTLTLAAEDDAEPEVKVKRKTDNSRRRIEDYLEDKRLEKELGDYF